MTTVRIHVAYDGTDFHGWQVQPNIRTVQGELMHALATIHNVPATEVAMQGASRTDSGVHALGQVASFEAIPNREVWDYIRGFNALTGPDITVTHGEVAPEGFNARHHSRGKIYKYRVWNHRFDHPLRRRQHWWVREPLAFESMQRAASQMLGERDFSSFRASDCQAATTTRRIDSVTLTTDGVSLEIEVIGSAFLKYMVRIMAGTLVDVGRGLIEVDAIEDIIASADRTQAGSTAPARGLTLIELFYPAHPWVLQPEIGHQTYY